MIRAVLILLLALPQNGVFYGQNQTTSGGGGVPSFITSAASFAFSTGATISAGTVNTGDIIYYLVGTTSGSQTFTMTDNCASGGASDTNVVDPGSPVTNGATTTQSGHFVVGLGRSGCTVTYTWTGSGDGVINIDVVRGSSGLDVVAALNFQSLPGTGANAVTSKSVTTTQRDLCIGAMIDYSVAGNTMIAGTTIAWVIGAIDTTFPNGSEWFAQIGPGAITATFTDSGASTDVTGVSCFHP
jgi:hypothetical protein